MISEQTVKDFQEAVKTEYGIQLDPTEAHSVLQNWVGYFDLLAKINFREKADAIK